MGTLLGSEEPVCVLISHRNSTTRRKLTQRLERHLGARAIVRAEDCRDTVKLDAIAPDIILIDLADADAILSIGALSRRSPRPSILALAEPNQSISREAAIRAGADEALDASMSGEALAEAVATAIDLAGPVISAPLLPSFLTPSPRVGVRLGQYLGSTKVMQDLFDQIDRISASGAPVIVTGGPGVGKSRCARALHDNSNRADGPFVTFQCAIFEGRELEEELFGIEAGVSSEHSPAHRGALEEAHGGTLYLDEIGALTRSAQARLLRYFYTDSVFRLGGTDGHRVDVRIVCASDEAPQNLVERGRLREELFYRLSVLPIRIPPLCERADDIVILANTFLHLFTEQEEKAFQGINPDAEQLLLGFDWPGNARQLQNVIRRIVVMQDGPKLTYDMLSAVLSEAGALTHAPIDLISHTDPVQRHYDAGRQPVEPFWLQERRIIEEAVDACDGNISQAAAALEISPSTIYRKRLAWTQPLSN